MRLAQSPHRCRKIAFDTRQPHFVDGFAACLDDIGQTRESWLGEPQIGGDDEGRRRLKFGRSKLRFRFDDPFFALGVVV